MNAIIPLNIVALRVSPADKSTGVVGSFVGPMGKFNELPYYYEKEIRNETNAITGDTIFHPLEGESNTAELEKGIHLHWELPDYFRKGRPNEDGTAIIFPPAPNRWLVIRYLSIYEKGAWQETSANSWVVESDYLQPDFDKDSPVPINVPLSLDLDSAKPFSYMGRVVEATAWSNDQAGKNYLNKQGNDKYLTAIGFLGAEFSAYYPDCHSVFGFVDRFLDQTEIKEALEGSKSIKFKASYQVIGWVDGAADPLDGLKEALKKEYTNHVAIAKKKNAATNISPVALVNQIFKRRFNWLMDMEVEDQETTLDALPIPTKTLCSGIMQEVVWDMLADPGNTRFLANPDQGQEESAPNWQSKDLKLAIGNSSMEALSALLKNRMKADNNYELILNALQLGVLNDMDKNPNSIIGLEEKLHENSFRREDGGHIWDVQEVPDPNKTKQQPQKKETLSIEVLEILSELNEAQKAYDMGRKALSIRRRQLFMDWYRYQKENLKDSAFANEIKNVGYIANQVEKVTQLSDQIGRILNYTIDKESGSTIDITTNINDITTNIKEKAKLSNAVKIALMKLNHKLKEKKRWKILTLPASPFYTPTNPVAVIDSPELGHTRRNGDKDQIAIRLSDQILDCVKLDKVTLTVNKDKLSKIPLPATIPYKEDVQALIAEAHLLIPSLIPSLEGGTDEEIKALKTALGGSSPLENEVEQAVTLFNSIRVGEYVPKKELKIEGPAKKAIVFSNKKKKGWLPNAIGWNKQSKQANLSTENHLRVDPFLPMSLIWNVTIHPLEKLETGNYHNQLLSKSFHLDEHGINHNYKVDEEQVLSKKELTFKGAAIISNKVTYSLTDQINNFIKNYPRKSKAVLKNLDPEYFDKLKITTQTLSGLNTGLLSKKFIPQIPIENLTISPELDMSDMDYPTYTLEYELTESKNKKDNWYDDILNGQAPLRYQREFFFGPLRGGYMTVDELKIVDVFGQTMKLNPSQINQAMMMTDKRDATKIYLPPRIMAPTRLWFRWLCGDHTTGKEHKDFVEMNSHPAASPVFGWILPNHLNNSLFFYDIDGKSIGSFGVEHDKLQYRTHAGNLENDTDDLSRDIGPKGSPTVNHHLADYMWFIKKKGANFLEDLMQTILGSDEHINPSNFSQEPSLAVLIGRPLALTRAVLSIETAGHLLPIDQGIKNFKKEVKEEIVTYEDRMKSGSANLLDLKIPIRLGDLSHTDDGLVGFIIEEETDKQDLENVIFYSYFGPDKAEGIKRPTAETLQLQLNSAPIHLTMLLDPRAAIHATTGILPVNSLKIPPNHYVDVLQNLEITFFTMPILEKRTDLIVPLPKHNGYTWSWIYPGTKITMPLKENEANHNATWDYTPQKLLEGWIQLKPKEKNDALE